MKRLCTEQEKQLLKRNWKHVCTSFSVKSVRARTSDIFLMLFIWAVAWFGLSIALVDYLNEWMHLLLGMVIGVLANRIVGLILHNIRLRKVKKDIFKKKKLLINGATVVSVEDKWIELEYTFVEDDERLKSGKLYGVTVTTYKCDISDIQVGERLLLIYEDDGQGGASGNVSLQIMKMTPEMQNMIAPESHLEMSKLSKETLACFPHPNGAAIEKEVRRIEELEREKITQWYVNKEKRTIRIMLIVFGIVFLGCLNGAELLSMCEDGFQYGLQGESLAIYIGLTVVIFLFLFFMRWLFHKRIEKSASNIHSVQEVLFKTVKTKEKGQTSSVFYEWDGTKFVEKEYINTNYHADYGKVFYKYSNEQGMAIFVEKTIDKVGI